MLERLFVSMGIIVLSHGAAAQINSTHDTCATAFMGADGTYLFTTEGSSASGVTASGLPAYISRVPNTACQALGGQTGEDLNRDVWVAWTAGLNANYRISSCSTASFDTKLALYDGSCGAEVALACNDDAPGCSGLSSELYATKLSAGTTYYVQIGAFGAQTTGTGALTLEPVVQCSQLGDDLFEPNDSCGSPWAIDAGNHQGWARAYVNNDDYYRILGIEPSERLVFAIAGSANDGDLDLELWDANCATLLDSSAALNSSAELVWATNTTGSPTSFVVKASLTSSTPGCVTYTVDIGVSPDPCLGPDDALEENDTCAAAFPLGDGTYPGLLVRQTDRDFYEVLVEPGGTLQVDLAFEHSTGDVDVYLYAQDACGDVMNFLEQGFSASDDEHLSWTNTTDAAVTCVIEVRLYSFTDAECNNYDMTLVGTSNGTLGLRYCTSAPNSVSASAGALITAMGSTSVAANNLILTAGPMAPSQTGIFYYGSAETESPFGNGFRCIELTGPGTLYRLFPSVVSSGTGMMLYAVDNELPSHAAQLQTVGETWKFQAWYRDPAGGLPGFNLSDGLSLTLTP